LIGEAPGLDLVVYGSMLIVVVAVAPRGIVGVLSDRSRRSRLAAGDPAMERADA